MGIFLVFIAALFIPLTNLCLRKSVDAGGSAKAFFVFQMLISFLLAILMNPVRTGNYAIHPSGVLLGVTAGMILSVMLYALGKAVEKGPPGLTFSILNSATVMPGFLMALLFGIEFGFIYNLWHGLGSFLVLLGMFWAGRGLKGMQDKRGWVFFCIVMFSFHVLLLSLYQWRAMLLNLPHPEELVSFFTAERIRSEWFTPFMFFSCGLIQTAIYLRQVAKRPKPKEILFGSLGGLSNILCTFFLIWSTEEASPLENAIIFPIFSVVGIVLTNAWGQKLYKEKVNWYACLLCVLGLVVGTVNWDTVLMILLQKPSY